MCISCLLHNILRPFPSPHHIEIKQTWMRHPAKTQTGKSIIYLLVGKTAVYPDSLSEIPCFQTNVWPLYTWSSFNKFGQKPSKTSWWPMRLILVDPFFQHVAMICRKPLLDLCRFWCAISIIYLQKLWRQRLKIQAWRSSKNNYFSF